MSTIEFVTTFSQKGYHVYGQRFIDSFIEHVGHPLTIYHESQGNIDFHDLLTWRNLDYLTSRTSFIQDWGNDKEKVGSARDPNSQAIRFCHKVFAVADAVHRSGAEWVIWVDADVEWTSRFTESHAKRMLEGRDLAFLGRTDAPYTECGFVAYRVDSPRVRNMVADMFAYYVTGAIFKRPKSDWHDSRCFDICRAESGITEKRQNNLSEGTRGWHPWPMTILAEFSRHHKGPARKIHAYNGTA